MVEMKGREMQAVNGRPPFDLMWEFLSHVQAVNHFGREVVDLNRGIKADYGTGLKELVKDVFYYPDAYENLHKDFAKALDMDPRKFPVDTGLMMWTRDQIGRIRFDQINWTELADKAFPVLDEEGYDK